MIPQIVIHRTNKYCTACYNNKEKKSQRLVHDGKKESRHQGDTNVKAEQEDVVSDPLFEFLALSPNGYATT